MTDVILADRGDEQKVIAEEKEEWVYQVLVAIGIGEDLIVDLDNDELISYLTSMEIEIFDHCDGSVEIIRKNKVVAEWKSPKLTLMVEEDTGHLKDKKQDKVLTKGKIIDKRRFYKKPNNYYYQIELVEWALPFQMSERER